MKQPLELMLLLILVMFVAAFVCRMWAVKFGTAKLAEYALPNASNNSTPDYVHKVVNNLNNQFQLPLVFIAACVLAIGQGLSSDSLVTNAWGFVISRYLHALVHVTINQVLLRSLIFGVGVYFLVSMWWELFARF